MSSPFPYSVWRERDGSRGGGGLRLCTVNSNKRPDQGLCHRQAQRFCSIFESPAFSFTLSSSHSLSPTHTVSPVWKSLFCLCLDQRIYRSPEFSFKTQTKINYEHYLLYIFIQKGIPAMGCLDAVLAMGQTGFNEGGMRGGGGGGFWERLQKGRRGSLL